MKKLSKEQINEIAEQVSGSSIKSIELKEDLKNGLRKMRLQMVELVLFFNFGVF